MIGGLSFTAFKAPECMGIVESIAVWVNALRVEPSFRGQGVASKLIQYAQHKASPLYALTDVPLLYTKLGWCQIQVDKDGTVVSSAGVQRPA